MPVSVLPVKKAPAVSEIYSASVSTPIHKLVKKPVVAVRVVKKKLVVVACVVVELPVIFKFPIKVEEAVALEPMIKFVVVANIPAEGCVNGSEPPPPVLKSVPQLNFPPDQVIFPVVELQVCKSAPKKFVVEAVVKKAVVVVA